MGIPHVETFKKLGGINQDLNNSPYDKIFIFQYMFDGVLLWQRPSGWSELKCAEFANGS